MVTHNCTRCKEDVGEVGIRHKYAGGLFCEPCLDDLRIDRGTRRSFFGGLWGLWDFFKDIWHDITSPFIHRTTVEDTNRAVKVAYLVQKSKARDIPVDMSTSNPQKM